jgi:hypothetical protein
MARAARYRRHVLKVPTAEIPPRVKRRVLLLLVIWMLRDRDRPAAERIAGMLPAKHAAVTWALGEPVGKFKEALLDDLGDPTSVEQVLLFMKPKKI